MLRIPPKTNQVIASGGVSDYLRTKGGLGFEYFKVIAIIRHTYVDIDR